MARRLQGKGEDEHDPTEVPEAPHEERDVRTEPLDEEDEGKDEEDGE